MNAGLKYFVNNCRFQFVKSSHPEVFLGKGVLKICSKFTGEQPCRSAVSIELQSKVSIKLHLFSKTPLGGSGLVWRCF